MAIAVHVNGKLIKVLEVPPRKPRIMPRPKLTSGVSLKTQSCKDGPYSK